jgi:hypothetical protein
VVGPFLQNASVNLLVLKNMSEPIVPQEVTRRKKTSRVLFGYTGKEYVVKSKEHPEGLHPGAAAWIEVVKEAGKPLDRDACLAGLTLKETSTKQPAIRIIYYWKKFLVEGGWLVTSKKEHKVKPAPATVAAATPVPPTA